MTAGARLTSSILALIVVTIVAAGCRSGLADGGDWSRSYVQPADRVWDAVLDTLAEEGFVADESDRDAGRILATGGDSRMWREALLEITVHARGKIVRIAIGGRLGNDPGADFRRLDELVRTLLASLDERLLGHPRSSAP